LADRGGRREADGGYDRAPFPFEGTLKKLHFENL
jgi:hypothetical protein